MAGLDGLEPKNALWRRDEQLKRWNQSETNKESSEPKDKDKVKVCFQDGCVFLAACTSGDRKEVERLLERGADINTANVDGLTALIQACIDDNIEMVQFLVEHKADIDACDNEGWTALHATASCGYMDIAKYLVENGANVAAVNSDGELPIDISDDAAMEDMLSEVMMEQGVDAEAARSEEEKMMLNDAYQWLNDKQKPDQRHPKTGATALHVAAAKGYEKVMKILLEAGADVNAQDLDGWTPLHAAAHWEQEDACQILVEAFCDMNIKNESHQTAFDVADSDILPFLRKLRDSQEVLKKDKEAKKETVVSRAGGPAPLKRRSSVTRMSIDQKQSLGAKSSEEERAHMEALRSAIQETEELVTTASTTIAATTTSTSISTSSGTSVTSKTPTTNSIGVISNPLIKRLEDDSASSSMSAESSDQEGQVETQRQNEINNRKSHHQTDIDSQAHLTNIKITDDSTSSHSTSQASTGKATFDNNISPPHPSQDPSTTSGENTSKVQQDDVLAKPDPMSRSLTDMNRTYNRSDTNSVLGERKRTSLSNDNSVISGSSNHISRSYSTDDNRRDMKMDAYISWRQRRLLGDDDEKNQDISRKRPISASGVTDSQEARNSTTTVSSLAGGTTSTTTSSGRAVSSIGSLGSTSSTSSILPAQSAYNKTSSWRRANTNDSTNGSSRRSYEPPKRDEERETERKAKAKKARETRRSTQGVTKEDLERAEQTLAAATKGTTDPAEVTKMNKLNSTNTTATTSTVVDDKSDKENSRPGDDYTSSLLRSSRHASDSDRIEDDLKSRRNRETTDSSSYLRSLRTSSSLSGVSGTSTSSPTHTSSTASTGLTSSSDLSTSPAYRSSYKNRYLKDEQLDDNDREDPSQKSASIRARRKRESRRPTGKINPEDLQGVTSDEKKEDTKTGSSRYGSVGVGSSSRYSDPTGSGGSSVYGKPPSSPYLSRSERSSSYSSAYQRSLSSHSDKDTADYKTLYEEEKQANEKLRQEVKRLQTEAKENQQEAEKYKKKSEQNQEASNDKRERRALERKISEMEEELKMLESLKTDNQRLKDENGALIRVISKLSK